MHELTIYVTTFQPGTTVKDKPMQQGCCASCIPSWATKVSEEHLGAGNFEQVLSNLDEMIQKESNYF